MKSSSLDAHDFNLLKWRKAPGTRRMPAADALRCCGCCSCSTSAAVGIELLPPERLVIEVASRSWPIRNHDGVSPADKAEDIASTHHGDAGESSRSDER